MHRPAARRLRFGPDLVETLLAENTLNQLHALIAVRADPAPAEDNDRLSVILSKAFLLADDTKITDPTIVAQLGRRV